MKTRCIFSFCLNSKETHSRWKMISLSPSSESGPGLRWTNEVFQVSGIKFLGTANNLRQKGGKKKAASWYLWKVISMPGFVIREPGTLACGKTLFSTPVRKTGGDRCDKQSTSGYKSCSIKEAPLSLPCPPVGLLPWHPPSEAGLMEGQFPRRVFLHRGPDLLLLQLLQRNK